MRTYRLILDNLDNMRVIDEHDLIIVDYDGEVMGLDATDYKYRRSAKTSVILTEDMFNALRMFAITTYWGSHDHESASEKWTEYATTVMRSLIPGWSIPA